MISYMSEARMALFSVYLTKSDFGTSNRERDLNREFLMWNGTLVGHKQA